MQTTDFIHTYVPAKADSPLTLLMLHGTGGDEKSLLSLGSQLAPGAALLSPLGKIMEGSSPRFFRRKAEGVFDIEDLIFRTHELADWIETAITTYGIDRSTLVAVGYSNGANIAASILLLRPTTLKQAILLRPMLPLQPEQMPDLTGARVLVENGLSDMMIPMREAERLVQVLEDSGADVTFEKHPANHGLVYEDLVAARAWLQDSQP